MFISVSCVSKYNSHMPESLYFSDVLQWLCSYPVIYIVLVNVSLLSKEKTRFNEEVFLR